jgi:hypothetical protein
MRPAPGLMALLGIDELQAKEHPRHAAAPARRDGDPEDRRPAGRDGGRDRRPEGHPGQARAAAHDHLRGAAGDHRPVRRRPPHHDHRRRRGHADEDFIPDEDMVVTITYGGYAKRTRVGPVPLQKRGGKGVRGASLRSDDEVQHLFTTTSHHWLLFFTNFGRVYRAKAWQLPERVPGRQGRHVANLMSLPARRRRSPGCSRSVRLRRRAVPAAGDQEGPGQEDAT